MSQPKAHLTKNLPAWVVPNLLKGTLRGVEREALRMQSDGFISQESHPKALGAPLTHPYITTDYSEALMEFITPPLESIEQTLEFLKDLHTVAAEKLPEGEQLWAMSMPCMLNEEDQVPLAQYGTSNLGRYKTLYRHGLGLRYGRRMQTIAGLHYNISFPDALFEQLQQHETNSSLKQLNSQDYKSARYFGLIRNFIRLTPMIMFLMGASPTVCRSFLKDQSHGLDPLVGGTLYKPYATAFRMGDIGYQNSSQKSLGIHYNDLQGYLNEMQKATKMPYAPYTALGLKNTEGEQVQVNDHILQAESEYYSLVRPKQVPKANESASQALQERGVQYVELRAVDINPYSPIGIEENSAAFLEILALHCLLQDSPIITSQEQDQIEQNQKTIIEEGRNNNAKILTQDQDYTVTQWLDQQLESLAKLAPLFDEYYQTNIYAHSIETMQKRIVNVEETLSSHVVNDMVSYGGTRGFGRVLAAQHRDAYRKHTISSQKYAYFEQLAKTSWEDLHVLEQDSKQTFQEYLSAYH